MRTEWLESFIAAAETGSVTAAAERLYCTPQAVSQHVQALEAEVGATLLDRTSRGVRLTARGVEYLTFARDMVDRLQLAKTRASGADGNLACAPSMSSACPFAGNPFCSALSLRLRGTLCHQCRIERYARFSRIDLKPGVGGLAVLLDGVVAVGQYPDLDDPANCSTWTVKIRGAVMDDSALDRAGMGMRNTSDGELVRASSAAGSLAADAGAILSVTATHVAFFGRQSSIDLFRDDIEFVQQLYWNVAWYGSFEPIALLASRASAHDSVRHAVELFSRAGVADYTHQQVAVVSNRSRPVVTKIMHQLAQEEPWLFEPR